MGHLEVAVITEKKPTPKLIAECMEPFDQDLEVEPYICAEYPEVKKRLRKYSDLLSEQEKKELFEALDKDDIGTILYYSLKMELYEDVDKEGNAISADNPDAKWDYYIIKEGCGLYEQPNNYIQVKDVPRINLAAPEEKLRQQFPLIWHRWEQHILDCSSNPNWSQEKRTFAEFLFTWTPWAVLKPDGEWIEQEGKFNTQWNDEYNKILDSFPGDYYLTCVNIHM